MANWQIYTYTHTQAYIHPWWQTGKYIHTHTHTYTRTYIHPWWETGKYTYIYIHTHTHIIYIKYKYKYESYEIGTLKAQAITKSKENILVWASKHLNIMLYYFHKVW